ncbi:MAG: phosphatidylglycerophosphatase [Polaromonas sp.]|nr:phosphatidylglycerophosphatase [Polaromonas sp.]
MLQTVHLRDNPAMPDHEPPFDNPENPVMPLQMPVLAPLAVPVAAPSPLRPSAKFLLAHPAHFIALGFGSGLSPMAPGTAGTLWAWLSFLLLQRWLTQAEIGWLLAASIPLGWWVCTITARNMRVLDPGSIVWDEIVAFWAVLWLVMPTGFWGQAIAFALFRYFDAAKPGPVGWADRLTHELEVADKRHVWTWAGFGIMLDDLVAAGCTLMVIALWRFFW